MPAPTSATGQCGIDAVLALQPVEQRRRVVGPIADVVVDAVAEAFGGVQVGHGIQPLSIWPPSTTRVWPVIQPAQGEARNRAACAISSGVPKRPNGIFASVAA